MADITPGPCAVFAPLLGGASVEAHATRVEDHDLWLELSESLEGLEVGARVIVEGPWDVRVLGLVAETRGNDVHVGVLRTVERDRRAAPRCVGGLDVRYAVATDASEAVAWMRRGELPAGGEWHAPDPFMSFSATGLEFEHRGLVRPHELVLLRIAIPGRRTSFRATARVVRVNEIAAEQRSSFAPEEPAPTHRIAVHFEDLEPEGRGEIIAHGLRIMRARHGA